MTANPVTAQDALEKLRQDTYLKCWNPLGEVSQADTFDIIDKAFDYLATRNLLAQPRNDAEAVRKAVEALFAAANMFAYYQGLHLGKKPPDIEKADRNRLLSDKCASAYDALTAALQSAEKEGGGAT